MSQQEVTFDGDTGALISSASELRENCESDLKNV